MEVYLKFTLVLKNSFSLKIEKNEGIPNFNLKCLKLFSALLHPLSSVKMWTFVYQL